MALKDSGREEDTLIVDTADHGLALGQHGLLGKRNVYQHSLSIPMFISGPGLPKRETREAPCCLKQKRHRE